MKNKVIGILVCMMLMTTFLTVVTSEDINLIEPINREINISEPLKRGASEPAIKPNWTIGEKWSYKINDLEIRLDDENLSFSTVVFLSIDDFSLLVVNTDNDLYQLELYGEIIGNFSVSGDVEAGNYSGPIIIEGVLEDSIVSGNVYINQSDLALVSVETIRSGVWAIQLKEQPFIDFPFGIIPSLTLRINSTTSRTLDLDSPLPIIKFPLIPLNVSNPSNESIWGLPSVNFSIGGTIESKGFEKIDNWNDKIRASFIYNLLPPKFKDISDFLEDFLPVIDIEYVLNDMLAIGNVFNFIGFPPLLYCNNTENITVNGTEYFVYKISIFGLGESANIYYAPEVGNIVKITGDFKDVLPFVNNIDMELMKYQQI
jgi:hypothetical protein